MRRSVKVLTLGLLALAGVAAGVFVSGGNATPVQQRVTITKITVTASEFKFVLSKRSIPAPGTVVFTVVNKGKIAHDFKIAGKKTPTLKPGKSAKLTVKFTKKGQFAYTCTLPGHATAGMKGKFAVAAKPVATPTTTTTPAAPPPPVAPPSGSEPLQGDPVAGATIFKASGCASCHTLAAAGASGNIGPNLDLAKPSQALVRQFVSSGSTSGGSTMPAFNISGADLNNLAAYVYQSTH
jgi:uncharacterized cupredoxin-like copper-binding protein